MPHCAPQPAALPPLLDQQILLVPHETFLHHLQVLR